MRVMPIRYSADVAAAIAFYRVLGLDPGATAASGVWADLPATSGSLALHRAEPPADRGPAGEHGPGWCELALVTDEPLGAVHARLVAAGYAPDAVVDEAFGRSFRVADPDGVVVQVNEHDENLHG
nr:VOC family protein [Kineosporia sp. A_224]